MANFVDLHLEKAKGEGVSKCTHLQVPKRSAIKECPSPRDADVLDA